jgi:glyoxylase-like metal-dependent hydrolase (beta-lactamase superfamily II)
VTTTLGPLRIDALLDGALYGEPARLFGPATPIDWSMHQELLTPSGQLEIAIGGFLVRGVSDRTVLIDTGYGADHPSCGRLTDTLSRAGVDPTEVTDVILTHLHKDHIGGVMERGRITFPNATYRCHAADWAYFSEQAVPRDVAPPAEKLAAVEARLETWDSSCTLLPGLDIVEAPGHTPGSSIVVLSAQERRAVILGDVVHCAVQLLEPEWSTMFDVDPAMAAQTRARLVRELEGEGVEVAGGHFPGLSFGRLVRGAGRRRFVFS